MTRAITALLSRVAVGTRITAGFGVILIFVAAISLFALQRVDGIGDTVDELVRSGTADSAMADVRAALVGADRAVEHFLRTRSNEDHEAAKRALVSLEASLAAADKHAATTKLLAGGIGPIKDGIASYRRSFDTLAGLMEQLAAGVTKTESVGAKIGLFTSGILTASANAPDLQGLLAPYRLPSAVEAMRVSVMRYTMSQSGRDAGGATMAVQDALTVAEAAAAELSHNGTRVKALVETVKAGILDDQATVAQLVATTKELQAQQARLASTSSDVEGAIRKISNGLAEARAAQGVRTAAAADDAWSILIAAGLAAMLAGAALAWVLSRSVSVPVTAMTRRMNSLAAGELEAPIPGEGHRDEIGQMAHAVAIFRDAAVEKEALAEEAAHQRASADAERARNEAERAAVAEQQASVVADLAAGLAQLAEGDLTGRLRAFPDDYKTLETDFNAAITKLQRTISVIAGSGRGIHTGTGEISQAADDLSRRTEQQAASLEETAAALDEITATVRKTAEGARHARETVLATKSDAESSGKVVQRAVAAMEAIEQSASQISQIIGVIDEIAFQTNLLALNAGVEAARAGDAGRGFAVVASEVRALAQRSAQAAKEIKSLISTSSAQVGTGVELVGETGRALTRIAAQVNEITGIVGEIAASAQEQATALAEVNTAINQMDQVTQQNSAMVEETTAASHSLAQEAEALTSLIGQFRVGAQTSAVPPTRARPAPAQAVARTAAPMSRGNTALARSPEPAGWEEF
jgi:methyl-accepting chemotaxis protein